MAIIVTILYPMKRGLKGFDNTPSRDIGEVTILYPMKRGLKEHIRHTIRRRNRVLQSFTR